MRSLTGVLTFSASFISFVTGHAWYAAVFTAESVDPYDANYLCQNTWTDGHRTHRFLASAHSNEQFQSMNEECASLIRHKGPCWTGLVLHHSADHNISYSYFDGSEFDFMPIWCDGSPITYKVPFEKPSNNVLIIAN